MTETQPKTSVRIGGAAGYWGDSQDAPRQFVMQGDIDYLVFDYLAEVTMSILVRAKEKSPDAGYARDFVELVMKPLLPEIKARGIRVVANAGGVNVRACARALAEVAETAGIDLKIGTVEGDDLSGRIDELRERGVTEMFTGAPLPEKLVSANAYLGAFPIAAALDGGADVVITGRCVDSAVTLGPLIHEFGWGPDDFDRLASGTLAGHVIECGAQVTGGNFTDWHLVADGWDDMGYPIAECRPDGSFTVTKPDGTGGLVSALTVGEQILYELGDPAAYVMPDVICDFRGVTLTPSGPDRLDVEGAVGIAPTPTYKVSATYMDGYRATASMVITGFEAVDKGRTFAEKLLKRTRRLFAERNLGDYRATALHLIGAETLWGANASEAATQAREITARIDVHHDQRAAAELFSKETTGVSLSMTTGRCSSGAAGRPKVTPVVAQYAFLVPKADVTPSVRVDGAPVAFDATPGHLTTGAFGSEPAPVDALPGTDEESVELPLIRLAVARSGDKGDSANVGIIARRAGFYPHLRAQVTPEKVRAWFSHVAKGDVSGYLLPGMNAMNFVLTETLDGGGTSSLHLDTQAKTYAQQLLAMPVRVPVSVAEQLSDLI
jgi:hypothetical protein